MNELLHQMIGASIEVHRTLGGPGLLEGIYEAALFHELALRGRAYGLRQTFGVERSKIQVMMQVYFSGGAIVCYLE